MAASRRFVLDVPRARAGWALLVGCGLVGATACGGSVSSGDDGTQKPDSGKGGYAGNPTDTGGSHDDDTGAPPTTTDSGVVADAPGRDVAADTPPARTEPPPYPTYSGGKCPTLVYGSTSDTAVNLHFASSGDDRQFRLLVPKSYDGTTPYPLMFAWHWLNASSGSFVSQGELESATEQMRFIAVLPDDLKGSDGKKTYQLDWPFAEAWGQEKELTFFDDLLACVDEQFKVDHHKVYGVGVSAGGLWVTYLSTTKHVQWLAAVESLSGGLGDEFGVWKMDYAPQPNKFPALVLWGGPSDWLGLSFEEASMRYRDALIADGHFVVTCTHDKGHAMPPIPEPTDGTTKFKPLWEFMLDHPYGLPAGTSPWQKTGLPPDMPPWCEIATP
jgi:hypothetical protein